MGINKIPESNQNEDVKIAVIDTGYFPTEYHHFASINGVTINKSNEGFVYSEGFTDEVGHGTIVCNLLDKYLTNSVELFVLKIFGEDETTDVELLTEAINYCNSVIKPDIIQASMGVLQHYGPLLDAICTSYKSGILVVSAFDNEKCLSYPAAYEEALGIDVSPGLKELQKFSLSEYDVVDVIGADVYHRAKGADGNNFIVHGSSFCCSYFSALAADYNDIKNGKNAFKTHLKERASYVFKKTEEKHYNANSIVIQKAIVFPFNKENHSIAAFESLLPYEISAYYDVRQSGKVNRAVNNVLGYSSNNKTIHNIDELNWDSDFDTFICGHTGEMSSVVGYDILDRIAEKCWKYNKQLYCYDNGFYLLKKYSNLKLSFPIACENLVPKCRFGKMRTPNVPTVGVFGTSSKQGKMTVQRLLRQAFLKKGINVKNIGSEPESQLLGFEFSYVFGYHSFNTNSPEEMVLALNEAVFNLEKSGCDLIIAGSQSGTVPHQLRHLEMLTLPSFYFLLGVQPDSVVLCVNCYDSFEYIRRTVNFIESAVGSKVLCLCVSYVNSRLYPEETKKLCEFAYEFNVPVFDLQNFDSCGMVELIDKFYEG